MIFKTAVKDFLNRKLDDWTFVKNIPREVLEKELEILVPSLEFKTKPRLHQLACCYISVFNPCFNLWLTMGTGKTKAVLDMVRVQQLVNKDVKRILVVCLGEVSYTNWKEEIKIHSNYTCTGLFGSRENRLTLLEEDTDIFIINYEGLISLLSVEGNSKKSKTKKVPDSKAIKKFSSLFDCLILDELPIKASSSQSLTFRVLKQLGDKIRYRYSLTGTPFGKNPEKLWSPYYLIDRGETLGETLGMFRASFFRSTPGVFGGVEYTFNSRMQSKLYQMLLHKSIRYTLSEVRDVPPVTKIVRKVSWSSENFEYYSRAVKGLTEEMKNKEDFVSINNSFVKLRQIVGGFLGFKNEEEEKLQIRFESNPKIDMLVELLLEIPDSEKIIIFNEFILSGDFIEEALKKHKIMYSRLYGGTKNKGEALEKFTKFENCRVFLVQNSSGGIGLNLQIAKYGIFYEPPVSCEIREQCEARYTGARQKHPHAFLYDIVMKNSIDEKILASYKEGKDITSALLEGQIKF